jgi:Bacterial regulatory proteins, luxR family
VGTIDVLEAAYGAACDDQQWLGGVMAASRPLLDEGHGMVAVLYDARQSDWVEIEHLLPVGVSGTLVGKLFNVPVPRGPASRALVSLFRNVPVTTLERQAPASEFYYHHSRDAIAAEGLADIRFVNAIDPEHRGCLLLVMSQKRNDWPARTVHRWSQVAAHVAAGLRVRRRLRRWAQPADAILKPDGKVEHAEGGARSQTARTVLRQAVTALDRARGPVRKSAPDEALAVWRGLVAGRWSLLDHFDSDGTRFIVAHRNAPELDDLRGLTSRERQIAGYLALGHSNKVIAYALGLSTSTVSAHAARVRKKLGLRSWKALGDVLAGDLAAPDGEDQRT